MKITYDFSDANFIRGILAETKDGRNIDSKKIEMLHLFSHRVQQKPLNVMWCCSLTENFIMSGKIKQFGKKFYVLKLERKSFQ